MVKIIKQELEFEQCLKQRLEFIDRKNIEK